MPLHTAIDHERQRVTFTWTAPADLADIRLALHRQATEKAWGYGVIHDTRAVNPDPAKLKNYVELIREMCLEYGPRGPVALVVAPGTIGSANRFALHRASDGHDTQVFWDRDEAVDWLEQRAA